MVSVACPNGGLRECAGQVAVSRHFFRAPRHRRLRGVTIPPLPFDLLGGDAGVRALVDRFYDLMDTAPEAAGVRRLHAESLKRSREKLYEYLTGWTGGPPLYESKYGHPRLRARHLPFAIGARERDQWLWCMDRALDAHEAPAELRELLRSKLHSLADHMRNQDEAPARPTLPLSEG